VNGKRFWATLRLYHWRYPQMLQLRPNCECCDRDLPPESPDARICSFECTFCRFCAEDILKETCPNCGGELVARPRCPAEKLASYPASTERVLKPKGLHECCLTIFGVARERLALLGGPSTSRVLRGIA